MYERPVHSNAIEVGVRVFAADSCSEPRTSYISSRAISLSGTDSDTFARCQVQIPAGALTGVHCTCGFYWFIPEVFFVCWCSHMKLRVIGSRGF
jgi:hypothetical protein